MRIEDITPKSIKDRRQATNRELYNLRHRFIQIYRNTFEGKDIKKSEDFDRMDFMEKYRLLRTEMRRRKCHTSTTHAIDIALSREASRNIKKKTINIQKPEITDTQIRIPIGSPCDITATITIDEAKGVQALYCGAEKRIRTYLFDKEKWTMATARAWIKEHKKEANIDKTRLEKSEIEKKLTAAQRKECDAETIQIKENEKKAKFPHEFKTAKYTHPNGHPRCLACGDEQPIGDVCGMPPKWYDKHEWDDEEAWKKEREKIDFSKARANAYFKFIKLDPKKRLVGGVIYEPDTIDTQGDFVSLDSGEIQKAMYGFMEKYFKDHNRIKIEHKGRTYAFPIYESFIPEEDTKKGNDIIKAGAWWIMIKIKNATIWKMIEEKKLQGFSMGGRAKEASPKR